MQDRIRATNLPSLTLSMTSFSSSIPTIISPKTTRNLKTIPDHAMFVKLVKEIEEMINLINSDVKKHGEFLETRNKLIQLKRKISSLKSMSIAQIDSLRDDLDSVESAASWFNGDGILKTKFSRIKKAFENSRLTDVKIKSKPRKDRAMAIKYVYSPGAIDLNTGDVEMSKVNIADEAMFAQQIDAIIIDLNKLTLSDFDPGVYAYEKEFTNLRDQLIVVLNRVKDLKSSTVGEIKALSDEISNMFEKKINRRVVEEIPEDYRKIVRTTSTAVLEVQSKINILLRAINNRPVSEDHAQISKMQAPGGIDLNSSNMGLTVAKDSNGGVNFPARGWSAFGGDPATIEQIKAKGIWSADPIIINITPINLMQIRPLLGLKDLQEHKQLASI